ncbi:MAG: hypothetical protein ACI4TB_11440, partial [Lachnospiraceae bacterium]
NRTYQLYQQRMQAYDAQQAAWQPQQAQAVQPQAPMQTAWQPQPVQTVQQPQAPMQTAWQPQQAQAVQQPRPAANKKNIEFAIGAGVLSIVGVLFVLVSFVMLGMTYMNGMAKGMCLYGIAVAVLLFSELFLTKKMPKFAIGITGLGICGLYLSTMLNYLYLGNFNGWIAMAISVVISLLAVFISRKKDSGTIKIISFVGCYICIFPIGRFFLEGDNSATVNMHFLVAAAIIFMVNLMTVFLPVKKNQVVVHIFHLIANMLFTLLFTLVASLQVDFIYILVYLISAILAQGLIFYCLEKPYAGTEREFSAQTAGNVTAYVTTVMLMLVCFVVESRFVDFGWQLHAAVGALLIVCVILFVLFRKRKMLKWIQYWMFCFVVTMSYGIMRSGENSYWWCMGVILGNFLLAKLLSRIKELRVSELIITIITALYALYFFNEPDLTWAICFLGAFLVSIAALHYWQSIYEEIILFVLEAFVLINFQNELTPAIMTGILFLGVIGFNSVELFRGKYIKIFNYVNLGFMVCLYLAAAFEKNHLSYAIMLLLGIAFMVFAFKERFGMDFKIKNIIFVLFLCYMTLIWDIPVPILKSIILMVIAIGAVTAGFIVKEKRLRISGLALTLVVCAKIALHDFAGAATTEKMVLFLIVGLIALAISGIYIALEKTIE